MSSSHISRDAEASPAHPTHVVPVSDRHVPSFSIIVLEIIWNIFDTLVLFRLGTIYLHRFEDFSHCTHRDEKADLEVTEWRNAQQAEWNSLATSLALLGTMNAAIIKISSSSGGAAVSLWLGAAGLSLCGVFMVQYYSIRAFPMANSQLLKLVSDQPPGKRRLISRKILAIAISGPPLMTFWATVLFVAGVVVYIWQTQWDRTRYKVFAFVPIVGGGSATLVALIFGEILGSMMYSERSREGTIRWCKHGHMVPRIPRQSVWEKIKIWAAHKSQRHPNITCRDFGTPSNDTPDETKCGDPKAVA